MRRLVVLVVLVTFIPGGGLTLASPVGPKDQTIRTTLYFLADDGTAPLGVRRSVAQRTPPRWGSSAGGALAALLAGPTDEDEAAGLTTAIPAHTEVLSFRLRGYGGTGAVVNLSGLAAIGDSLDRARIITQVTRTLVGVSGIERVWFRADGRPWGLWLMAGGARDGPYDYDNLAGFRLGAACPHTETVCDRFQALP